VYELPTINRFAMVLLPSEEYLKWTQTCADPDPNLTLADLWNDPSVYLIPEVEDWKDKFLLAAENALTHL